MVSTAQLTAHKRSKYFAKKVSLDGHQFDSKREAAVYGQLKLLERAGKISDLVVHLRYDLYVNHAKIGAYESDFVFMEDGKKKIVDVKGLDTALSRWKRKHVAAQYGVEVEIWK